MHSVSDPMILFFTISGPLYSWDKQVSMASRRTNVLFSGKMLLVSSTQGTVSAEVCCAPLPLNSARRCCAPSPQGHCTTSTWPPSPGCSWRGCTSSSPSGTSGWPTTPAQPDSRRGSCTLWATASQLQLLLCAQRSDTQIMEQVLSKHNMCLWWKWYL